MTPEALRYGSAGVDLESAGDAKQRLKRLVESTFTSGSVGGFGGFGGMFRVPPGMKSPILVSSADARAQTPESPLVLYCDGTECELSHRLRESLRQLGYTNTHLLFNGLTAWRQAGLPTTQGGQP